MESTLATDRGPRPGDPPGIDVARVTEWCADHVPGAVAPFTFTLVAGGRSNLTYEVGDAAGRRFALRRPPVSHVLPTAHDMAREHRIISALGPTGVPVPEAYDLCADPEVTGAPFYVMSFVDGHILRDVPAVTAAFPAEDRRAIGDHLADTLAALHAVDVDAAGLGDLGRHEGYIERQLRRWTTQFTDMQTEGMTYGDLILKVGADLAAEIPTQQGTSVVHGDYRLDNVVLDDEGRVRAILDWEICTLGDAMADLGILLVYWGQPDDDEYYLGTVPPSAAPGSATRDQVLARYAESSGRDVTDVSYYVAFGYWKLACILQGVYARYTAGAEAGDKGSVEEFPTSIARLAAKADETLATR